jgi:hypothetical protein
VSPRQTLRQATPDSETHHSKRQRTGYNDFTPVASEASPRPSVREVASPPAPWIDPLSNGVIDNSILRELHTNPYISQPLLVTDLLSVFFLHVPETAHCMFPEAAFKSWVLSSSEKTLDDLMLIYTILALGTIFSPKTEHQSLGSHYAAISRHACDTRHFSIQLVQSRFLLANYYFATNNPNDAWDLGGAALRAASGIKLNLEIEKSDDAYLKAFPYGLKRAGYAECRRRTFWSCYLMDRYNACCSGHLCVINPEDVFLRLPCDINSFESQAETSNPFFDHTTPPIKNTNWTMGSMAYLINIFTIWGDVTAKIYRNSQRPIPLASNAAFITFYESATRRLHEWKESLPSCYTFSAENLKRASNNGKLGTFMTMHTAYHNTAMKLNRYVPKSTLSSSQLAHHVSVAEHHAELLLVIMNTLSSRSSTPPSPDERRSASAKFSSPSCGYSIVSAIDILTAKLSVASIPARLTSFSGAQSVLAELSVFWQSSRNQQALVLQRIRDLAELASTRDEQSGAGTIGFNLGSIVREVGEGIFEMRDAIEKTVSRDYDCIYN